jgi:hypothetical protein
LSCRYTLGSASASADDLDALAGKWVADRTDAQGRAVKQVLEINKNKFKFQVTPQGEWRLHKAEPSEPGALAAQVTLGVIAELATRCV